MKLNNQIINMDLHRRGITPVIDCVQGDDGSRTLELILTQSGAPAELPENLAVLIRYQKADGKGGEYDALEDGSAAWEAEKNRLTIRPAPQMLTFPGWVEVTVSLISGGALVSTFPLRLNVAPAAKAREADSQDYFHITGFLVTPTGAQKGQYLQVDAVDEAGRVTGIRTADVEAAGMGGADWNAAADEPGHILNRPFYAETSYGTILNAVKPIYDPDDSAFYVINAFSLTAGMEYTIHWNGTPWVCTARELPLGDSEDSPTAIVLGDMGAMEGTPVTGEPFCMVILPPEEAAQSGGIYAVIMPMDGTTDLTLCIEGAIETVHPIDPKFLGSVKGQKRFILDLDNGGANANAPSPEEVDTPELQAGLTVIWQGVEHSATITNRTSYDYDGITEHVVSFSFIDTSVLESGQIITGTWRGGFVTQSSIMRFEQPATNNPTKEEFYVVTPGSYTPSWRKITDTLLDGIWLQAPGGKKYLITVDDNGNLVSEEKPF